MKKKKATLISITTYCSKAKVWSKEDMIIYHTKMEDEWNHPYQHPSIPKLHYPKSTLKASPGLLNFFKSSVQSVLP